MMTREEIAQEMLRRCEEGAMQKDACQALAEEIGLSPKSILAIYTKAVPKEMRPINGGTQMARRKREMERRERRDAQTCVTRCAHAGCSWLFEGTVGEGRIAHAEHRETCTGTPPTIKPHAKGSLSRYAIMPGARQTAA